MHLLRNQLLYIVRAGLSRSQAYQELSNWRQRKRMRDSTWYTTKLLDRVPAVHSGRWRMGLNDVLQDSVESFPLPLYLRVEDRNSMAHSIEARLPFLDYRLVQFAFNLSESWKMRGIWNKYILREAMRSRIPESVRKRVEKFGFPTPINRWIRESDSTVMEDLIQSDVIAKSGLFNVDRIRVDVERHLRNEINIGHEVFRLIQFEKWARITGLSVH